MENKARNITNRILAGVTNASISNAFDFLAYSHGWSLTTEKTSTGERDRKNGKHSQRYGNKQRPMEKWNLLYIIGIRNLNFCINPLYAISLTPNCPKFFGYNKYTTEQHALEIHLPSGVLVLPFSPVAFALLLLAKDRSVNQPFCLFHQFLSIRSDIAFANRMRIESSFLFKPSTTISLSPFIEPDRPHFKSWLNSLSQSS